MADMFASLAREAPRGVCGWRALNDELADRRKRHIKIKEIAFRYGFANPTHFSDAFRDHHGRSPSEVRRTASGGDRI